SDRPSDHSLLEGCYLAPRLFCDFVFDVHGNRRPDACLFHSPRSDPLYVVNSGSPRPNSSCHGRMESHELAPLVAWIHRRSFFIQRPRHLLGDEEQDNIDVKRARKPPPQNRKNDFGRQRIVDAARAHFFSHGFRSVTMDDLAEELGISKKTLYAHFPGKMQLLEAVLADKFAGVEAKLSEIA